MTIRRRVRSLEEWMGPDEPIRIPIAADGADDPDAAWNVAIREHRRRGLKVGPFKIDGVWMLAETRDDALAMVDEHKRTSPTDRVTVYRRDSRCREVLLEWEPPAAR